MGFMDSIRKIPGVPIVEGVYNRLSGKPTPVAPVSAEKLSQLTPEQRTAFNLTPEELKYIDYISNQVYNPNSAPSAAQSLLNQATNQSAMQAGGMIANARGATNPVLAARQAQQAMTEAQQGAINSASAMRAQEQQAAQNQYSDLNQRQRQAATQLVGTEMGINQANVNAQNQANAANASAYNTAATTAATNQANMIGNFGAGLAQNEGLFKPGSDIRLKKNIGNGENAIYGFLDSLDPYTYEYKDGGPKGTDDYEHIGIMAQDAERSPAGQRIVTEDKRGNKMLKPDLSTLLAAQAFNHKRLKELEAQGASKLRENSARASALDEKISGFPETRLNQVGGGDIARLKQTPPATSLVRLAQAIGGGGMGGGRDETLRLPPLDLYGTYKDRTPPALGGGAGGASGKGPSISFGEPEMIYYPPAGQGLTGYPYGKIGAMPRQGEQMRPGEEDYENIKRYLDMIGGY